MGTWYNFRQPYSCRSILYRWPSHCYRIILYRGVIFFSPWQVLGSSPGYHGNTTTELYHVYGVWRLTTICKKPANDMKGDSWKLGPSPKDTPTLLTCGEQYNHQFDQSKSPPCLQVSRLLRRRATSRHCVDYKELHADQSRWCFRNGPNFLKYPLHPFD